MALGPGKYDGELTVALLSARARAGILIVLDGAEGPGFSCQAPLPAMVQIPEVLRGMADAIEADMARGKL